MNDIDLDIILAIADNRLTGQAKQDALQRIAADPELGEELAAQIATMDELKSLDPALMTPAERATLRTNLIEQLHLSPAAPSVVALPQRRPWWQPALAFASAAALLVAFVAIPSMFSGSDDSSADFVAIAPATTTSVAAAELDASRQGSTSASNAASPTSTVLVPQIIEQEVQEFFAAAPPSSDTEGAVSSDDVADSGTDEETDETIAEVTAASAEALTATEAFAVNEAVIEACLETLADDLPDGNHIARAATLDDGATVVHFGLDTADGVDYSFSIDLEECVITSLNP
jgi:hypothetical protein